MDNKKVPIRINAELIYYQLDQIQGELREMKKLYVTKVESQALKDEIEELRKDVQDLKGRNALKNTVLWVGLTASAIINIVAAYRIFSGE
jgi:hypothetical protein